MADRMNVCRDGKPIYDIVMDTSFSGLKEEADRLSLKEHKICIVTDSNVAPLYLEEVKNHPVRLLQAGFRIHIPGR